MKKPNMIDIENILYDGNKDEINKIINEYEISYNYNKENNSFEFESMKLLEKSRGYGSNEIPNCVKFFGAIMKK